MFASRYCENNFTTGIAERYCKPASPRVEEAEPFWGTVPAAQPTMTGPHGILKSAAPTDGRWAWPSRRRTTLTTALARPVTMQPRLDAKPWGGRRLEEWGIALPPGATIGEALFTAPESTVASGIHAGAMLGELALGNPDAWIGARGLHATGGRAIFPLLVKLIDSQTDLSIQVHPDDRAAAAAGLGVGKTEAYHVLSAAPGSVIYLGLEFGVDPDAFAAACRLADGSAATSLRRVAATPGMTILIPAGTPHALGAGIIVYEIQQPSNETFRLDDWGRRDAAGVARPLHHDAGLAVIDPLSRPEPIPPVALQGVAAGREILVATRYFALERIACAVNDVVELSGVDSPQVLTCIRGAVMLDASGWVSSVTAGETIIVPASLAVALTGCTNGAVLRGWVPDLERDVIGPARAAGASDDAIRGLAGLRQEAAGH